MPKPSNIDELLRTAIASLLASELPEREAVPPVKQQRPARRISAAARAKMAAGARKRWGEWRRQKARRKSRDQTG